MNTFKNYTDAKILNNYMIKSNETKEEEYLKAMNTIEERWKIIYIDGVQTNYKISTHGNVRNYVTDTDMSIEISSNRYRRVTLYINGIRNRKSVHRLIAEAFIPIPKKYTKKGYTVKDLTVNHKDGVKGHNIISNLEWSTIRENTIHAFDTGLALTSMGEKSHLAKMSNEQAIRCCELLEQGYRTSIIAEIVGVTKKSVQKIKDGESWKRLASQYNFARIGKAIPNTLDDSVIHEICKDLEKKCYSDYVLGKKYGVSREYIRDIRTHKRRKNISSLYNF